MEKEIWKDIPEFKGFYQASNIGRIKTVARVVPFGSQIRYIKEKILKQRIRFGYFECNLSVNGKLYIRKSHRLVAFAFIPNPNKKLFINHKNGIKHDNYVDNLEWCTKSENMKHAYKTGLAKSSKPMLGRTGYKNHNSKEVAQYNTNGKLLKKFGSAKQASILLNINYQGICDCCNDRLKTSGGFIWEYTGNTRNNLISTENSQMS